MEQDWNYGVDISVTKVLRHEDIQKVIVGGQQSYAEVGFNLECTTSLYFHLAKCSEVTYRNHDRHRRVIADALLG